MADFNKSGTLPITATFVADTSVSNPLATHAWSVNGGAVEQTGSNFTRMFTAYGDYNITHAGTGTCGGLPCTDVTKSISITATPQPTTGGIPIEVILGSLVGVGVLGYIFTTMPKK